MDKHIAALEKLHNHASDRRYLSTSELEAIRAAIALMRGQSEVEVAVTANTPYGLGLIFVTDFNSLPADTMLYARIPEKKSE